MSKILLTLIKKVEGKIYLFVVDTNYVYTGVDFMIRSKALNNYMLTSYKKIDPTKKTVSIENKFTVLNIKDTMKRVMSHVYGS